MVVRPPSEVDSQIRLEWVSNTGIVSSWPPRLIPVEI